MFFLLFYYVAVSACCAWSGLLGLRIFARLLPAAGSVASASPVTVLMSGLMLLTIGGEWLVLFFPLQPWMLPVVFAGLHLLAGAGPNAVAQPLKDWIALAQRKKPPVLFFFALLAFLLLVLVFNAGPTRMDDTASYHIQSIRWMTEWGTVPGIANLHLRFGLNSAWFVAIGLLTHSSSTFNNYLSLNGLICVWFCFYLVGRFFAFSDWSGPSFHPPRALAVFAVLVLATGNWYFLRRSAASTSYDFIATLVVLVLFVETAGEKNPPGEWLLWPLFLFTVRIIHFPFLILSLVFVVRYGFFRSARRAAVLSGVALVVVAPFLIRNWVLSGFPFFPLTIFDGLPGNWKSDKTFMGNYIQYTRFFNRINTMYLPLEETRRLTGGRWIGGWWTYLFAEDKVVVVSGLAGYLYFWLRRTAEKRVFPVLPAVMAAAILSWFLIAPDPRFIQGVWLAGVFAGIGSLGPARGARWRGLQVAFCTASLLVAGYAVSRMIRVPECRNFFLPRRLPVPAVRQVTVGPVQLNIPARILDNWNPRCYDLPLPCLYQVDPRLVLRGSSLGEGFRLEEGWKAVPFPGEYIIK